MEKEKNINIEDLVFSYTNTEKYNALSPVERRKFLKDHNEQLDDSINGKYGTMLEMMEKKVIEHDPLFDKVNPYTWGTENADHILSPIEPNQFIIFSGPTGTGKTTFTTFLGMENSKLDHTVLYLSLEMESDEIIVRLCRNYAGITKDQWRTRDVTEKQKQLYLSLQQELFDNKRLIFSGLRWVNYLNPNEKILATPENIIKMYKYSKADLMIVDNFDLIKRDESLKLNESQMKIAEYFMEATSEIKKPIIIIHHFNKSGILSGSQKIEDNCDQFVIGTRTDISKTNPGEPDYEQLKAEYQLFQKKDRDWGDSAFVKLYFKKGKFYDRFEPERNSNISFGEVQGIFDRS